MKPDIEDRPIDEQYQLIVQRLETRKRELLIESIDTDLSVIVEGYMEAGVKFARELLRNIQQGNNPDLEGVFRTKIEELGIVLD